MNAPQRGALMLVRFVSVAMIGLSVLAEGLYVADCFAHSGFHRNDPSSPNFSRPPVAISKVHCALLAVPFLAGVVLLVASKPVAEWLSDKLDE